jgi:hypothetical protein
MLQGLLRSVWCKCASFVAQSGQQTFKNWTVNRCLLEALPNVISIGYFEREIFLVIWFCKYATNDLQMTPFPDYKSTYVSYRTGFWHVIYWQMRHTRISAYQKYDKV